MRSLLAALCMLATTPALADPPRIEAATASRGAGGWTVSVTLSHPDTGWDHYADGWEVLDAAGNRLGLRVLAHPHVNEQPFTRSLSGVQIPEGTTKILLRTRCLTDGWSSDSYPLALD